MHDESLVYLMDIVGTAFLFTRKFHPVSISVNGNPPQPYDYDDLVAESLGNATFKPSAITRINGQPATTWLENESKRNVVQDLDAAYNAMFYSSPGTHAGILSYSMGTFAACGDLSADYPGPTTTLQFANGTTSVRQNFALVDIPFDGVSDGVSLAKLWFPMPPQDPNQQSSSDSSSDSDPPQEHSLLPPVGYPPAVFFLDSHDLGGYYLDGQYSDVAVLAVTGMGRGSAWQEFQDAAVKFITNAKAHGKKKLIIDLSTSVGGTVPLAYDLFKILYPRGDPYATADRFRAFNTTKVMTDNFSSIAGLAPRDPFSKDDTTSYVNQYFSADELSAASDTDINGKAFQTWQQKFGPGLTQNGDTFSNLFRWNLSDVDMPLFSGGPYIHGYGPLSKYASTPQPFATSDIIIVSDGHCTGSCVVFAELMRKQGVKFVSLGGRSNSAITQAIGGSGGSGTRDFGHIQFEITSIINLSDPAPAAALNKTDLVKFFDTTILDRTPPGVFPAVNFRDAYRRGDQSNVPVHFKYTPADCRIFYTKEMILDISASWKAAADSAWGSTNHCVAGRLQPAGSKSSLHRRKLNAQELENTAKVQAWRDSRQPEDFVKVAKMGRGGLMRTTPNTRSIPKL